MKSRRKHILDTENSKSKSLRWERDEHLEELKETLLTWAKLKGAGVETPSVAEEVGSKEDIFKGNRKPSKGLSRELLRSHRWPSSPRGEREWGASMETDGFYIYKKGALFEAVSFPLNC